MAIRKTGKTKRSVKKAKTVQTDKGSYKASSDKSIPNPWIKDRGAGSSFAYGTLSDQAKEIKQEKKKKGALGSSIILDPKDFGYNSRISKKKGKK